MNVVFRADASNAIGTGHVMRCLTLASALRERHAAVSFVCRELEGHLCELVEKRGFRVIRLRGASEHSRIDATETRVAIETASSKVDWLVVDHYELDHEWEAALRASAGQIMAIDDIGRSHDCDVLLDQNLVQEMRTRYVDRVPSGCGMLLGPHYALLQPVYAQLHDRIPPREGPIQRLMIFFGGADTENFTGRSIEGFLRWDRPDVQVDVVVSGTSPHATAIRQQLARHPNLRFYSGLATLAPLMAKADLAIGAAGSTSWERLCLGLPALVVSLAENQRAIAEELNQHGLVRWLGHHSEVNSDAIYNALRELTQESEGLGKEWSARCAASVDGRGVDRVCAALTAVRAPLRARSAMPRDESLVLSWRDHGARRLTKSDAPIANGGASFRRSLRNVDDCRLYIVESTETRNAVELGSAKFHRGADSWTFDYEISPVFREPALETKLLECALSKLREDVRGGLILQKLGNAKGGSWRIGVCSDAQSWLNALLPELILGWVQVGHQVSWAHDAVELPEGDFCFYLSYGRIVGPTLLARHHHNLVVHASDLPRGRGWSPLTWQVLEGKNSIPITLFEATQALDSGPIYLQQSMQLAGNELVDDLRRLQADATFSLCRRFVSEYPDIVDQPRQQSGEATYYARRRPEDGELDPDKSLREQFNLLRVSDNDRYPAWMNLNGRVVCIRLEGKASAKQASTER